MTFPSAIFASLGFLGTLGFGLRIQQSILENETYYDVEEWESLLTRQKNRLNVEHTVEGIRNLCVDGYNMPRLFLLGAQKGGSTSLAVHLMKSGIIMRKKDKETFEMMTNTGATLEERAEHARASYQEHAELCSATSPKINADTTPHYFERHDIAPELVQLYGENRVNLTFALILREPVERLRSSYWYFKRTPRFLAHGVFNEKQNFIQRTMSDPARFHKAWKFIQKQMEHYRAGVRTQWMQASLYGQNLEAYLQHFSPSQFVVIPLNVYKSDPDEALKGIAQKLGVHYGNVGSTSIHANSDSHPSLDDDLARTVNDLGPSGKGIWKNLQGIFDKDADSLCSQLAAGLKQGMVLPAYHGDGSESSICAWLKSNW